MSTNIFVVVHVQHAVLANDEVTLVIVAYFHFQLRRRVQGEKTAVDDLLLGGNLECGDLSLKNCADVLLMDCDVPTCTSCRKRNAVAVSC